MTRTTSTSETDFACYQAMWWDGPQLSDFVLVLQLKQRSRWTDIAKVDCCHREVHAHFHREDSSEEKKVLKPVATPADLRIGFDEAHVLIFDRWKNCLRRWKRGR